MLPSQLMHRKAMIVFVSELVSSTKMTVRLNQFNEVIDITCQAFSLTRNPGANVSKP